jgi:hypothetical protein
MSNLLDQDTITSEDSNKIATLLDHFIDNSRENSFSKQELSTVEGQVNQARSNSLSMQKELLKKVFSEQLIYPKVEIIRDGERSISSYSLIKKDVNDKFIKGFEPILTKNDVAVLREIYKNQTLNNHMMFELLETNKQILTMLTLQLSHTIDSKMDEIKR